MKEGESDEFSLGGLTVAELEVRRNTLSAYLVTLQEQCEEKRGIMPRFSYICHLFPTDISITILSGILFPYLSAYSVTHGTNISFQPV